MKNFFVLVSIWIIAIACEKISDDHVPAYLKGNGVFILNEGNFTWGNGSLSFYDFESGNIQNGIFENRNQTHDIAC